MLIYFGKFSLERGYEAALGRCIHLPSLRLGNIGTRYPSSIDINLLCSGSESCARVPENTVQERPSFGALFTNETTCGVKYGAFHPPSINNMPTLRDPSRKIRVTKVKIAEPTVISSVYQFSRVSLLVGGVVRSRHLSPRRYLAKNYI